MGENNANLLEEIRKTRKDLALSSETINQAHSSFTSQYTTFLSLAEQLENKFKELETRENAVEIREREVRDQKQQLQEREKACCEREQALEVKSREASTKLDQWHDTEKRMKLNADKLPSVVSFNVCGKRFAISKERILKFSGSLFEQILVSNHPQLTSTGEIYIERDPKAVRHVFRFILDQVLPLPTSVTEQFIIQQEFEYFKIPFRFDSFPPRVYPHELIGENKFSDVLKGWLPNQSFQNLYKATLDGFGVKDFHKHCDNKGPTLTLIRSNNGYLFGGYSNIPWDTATNTYKKSTNKEDTFLFTLTNPHNIPPTKYPCQEQRYAIFCRSTFGPTFGAHDICVSDNSHQNNSSYTRFPHSYEDTTGKGNNTFTGAACFTTSEIEVYSVISLMYLPINKKRKD